MQQKRLNASLQDVITKPKSAKGFVLWSLILGSYFLFAIAWISGGNLAGTATLGAGWSFDFLQQSNAVITNLITALTSFVGIIASFVGGWVLTKLGHKPGVLLAMILISVGVVTPWFGDSTLVRNDPGARDFAGFVFFLLGRMLLSTGGIMIFIYLQPLTAFYFKKEHTKAKLSALVPFGYNTGTLVATLPFVLSPEISQALIQNWRITATVFALPILILIIVYAIYGEQIPLAPAKKKTKKREVSFYQKMTKDALKDRDKNVITLIYSSWLVIAIIPLILFPSMLNSFSTAFGGVAVDNIGRGSYLGGYFGWGTLYSLFFVFGLVPGSIFLTWLSKKDYNKKRYLQVAFVLSLLGFLISIIGGLFGEPLSVYFGSILTGAALWSSQGVIGQLPHTLKDHNPQRVGTIYTSMSGVGYLFLLVFTLVLSGVTLISGNITLSENLVNPWNANFGSVTDSMGNFVLPVGQIVFIVLFVFLIVGTIPLASLLPQAKK